MQKIPHDESGFKQESFEPAESAHRADPSQAQVERLFTLACQQLRGVAPGETGIEPRGHLEILLTRIKAEPTPLPEIQQSPQGWGFISDIQARIFYLRKRFGFTIENRIDRSVSPPQSFYWIVLDQDGKPKMRQVPVRERKTGKPTLKHRNNQDEKAEPEADGRGQYSLLSIPAKSPTAADFADRERGVR